MPRTRRGLRGVRYDPIFGPAQAPDTAPGYNVPRGITFEQLRNIANIARQRNEPAISVKNQIRAIIAAAGLTSAAAGALTLRAFQYVDNKFGKRPRDTDASQAGDNHSRLRGVKEARTIDPQLPDYEDVSSREDDFVETAGNKFSDSIDAAVALQDDEDFVEEIERQEQEDQNIRNVLLRMRGDGGDIDIDVRGQHQGSFDDLPSSDQVSTQDIEPHPFDEQVMSETHDISMDDSEQPNTMAAARAAGPSNASSSSSMQVTPVAKIPPRYPFHQTEEAILEHYGSISHVITSSGDTAALRIRMNTYVQPYSETTGTVADANNWSVNALTYWYRQPMGRYVVNKGSSGEIAEVLYNRRLRTFSTPLFPTGTISDASPAGAFYYNLHYNTYTVTKCEWMVRVEFPFHCMKGTWTSNDTPTAAEVLANVSISDATTTPPTQTGCRVFQHYTMQGDTITGVNPPTNAPTQTMERWNNTYDNKVTVFPHGSKVIRGTWYPGMVKHNPLNDDDVQVWSTTGSVPGSSHLEHLVFQFKEIANANGRNDGTGPITYPVNIMVNCKWYVQFKERKTELQYPTTNQTNPAGTAINQLVLENYGVGTTQYPT